jgi:hypothetical protein
MKTAKIPDEKPFNLTARYDFNWRRPDKSTYSLWVLYDYEHTHYDNASRAISLSFNSDFVIGNDAIQDKKDVSHKISMGYSGTTQLNRPGWVLKSSADVSLQKRKVKDDWLIDEFPDGPDNAEQCRCLDLQVERNSGLEQQMAQDQCYHLAKLGTLSRHRPHSLRA